VWTEAQAQDSLNKHLLHFCMGAIKLSRYCSNNPPDALPPSCPFAITAA
jgi:hypothetical protein